MRTKKILAILSAIAMMGCLASCGGNSSTADSSSTAETTTAAAETTEATTTAATTTTAEPIPAPDAKAITFDTDSLYTAEPVMDSGAAPVELSIEEVNGNKKLKVHVLKAEGKEDADYEVPKIKFDLPALLGAENVGKIGHISADFYCNALDTWKNDDGSESLVVGNFLGAFGGNIASDKAYDKAGNLIQNNWANHYEFACDDWENPTHEWRIETDIPALLPANGYASLDGEYYDKDGNALDAAKVCEGQNLFIMRWGQKNSVDFYIDNLTFFDKDGNAMDVIFDPAAAPAAEGDTTDAPADTTAAAADTTAAAAADTTAAAADTTAAAQ